MAAMWSNPLREQDILSTASCVFHVFTCLVCSNFYFQDPICVCSPSASRQRSLRAGRSQQLRARRGGQMCLGLPTEWTHRWCLKPAEQNAESTETHTIWERQRSRERFHSHGEEWGVWCIEAQKCVSVCAAFGRLQRSESVCIFLGLWYFETDVLLQWRWGEIKIKP